MADRHQSRRREPRRLPPLADTTEQLAIIERWVQEDREQLGRLADELGIADGPSRWYDLALALATQYVPAFKEQAPQVKWTAVIRGMLVVEIERLTGDKRLTGKRRASPTHTATWAAGILSKRPEWADFLDGGRDPAEALRFQYSKFHRDPWAELTRSAFKYHRSTDTIEQWDMDLRDALKRV